MSEKTPRRDPYRFVGEVFNGRYVMEEFIVLGSFGAVYRATDQKLGRTVAVKVLKPDLKEDVEEDARELFQREAQAAGALNHSHIVAVTDVGEESGIAYLVMEWLEGRTLEYELRQYRRISLPDTTKILEQITSALHLAHEQNIVHRDIKPSNIHLGLPGEIFVKVLDFGIAKVITSATNAVASRIAGTFAYMPPEQIEGKIIDARTDIYALGVLVFQMLCGELPFEKKSEDYLIRQQLTAKPPRLNDICPEFNSAIADVIDRALEKNPDDRQQSVVELYESFLAATLIDDKAEILSDNFSSDEEKVDSVNSVNEQTPVENKIVESELKLDEPKASAIETEKSNLPMRPEVKIPSSDSVSSSPESINPFVSVERVEPHLSKSTKKQRTFSKTKIAVVLSLLVVFGLLSWFAISAYNNYQTENFDAHLQKGAQYLDKKQYDLALTEFDKAVNINSRSAEAFKGRADAFHFKGESEKAAADYTEALNLGLKDAEIFRRRGYDYGIARENSKAIADYSQAISLDFNDGVAFGGRCRVYLENQQFENALADCSKAIELNPDEATSYLNRGNAYLAKNENNLAIADFNKALSLQAKNAAAYLGRGNAFYNKGDYGKALDDYSEAVKLNPQNPAAYGLRGIIYQRKGNDDKAIEDFTEAIRLNPEFALVYASRGKSFLAEKKYDEAIDDYTNAIKFNNSGKATDFYFERGIAYYKKGEFDKAIADLTEVINLDPKSYGAYHNRGAAYSKQGKRDLAEADFKKERELKRGK